MAISYGLGARLDRPAARVCKRVWLALRILLGGQKLVEIDQKFQILHRHLLGSFLSRLLDNTSLTQVFLDKAEAELLVEARARQVWHLQDDGGNTDEEVFGDVGRLTLVAFEFFENGLVDSIHSEPLNVIILVHLLYAACDIVDGLFFFFRARSEEPAEHLGSNDLTLLFATAGWQIGSGLRLRLQHLIQFAFQLDIFVLLVYVDSQILLLLTVI